MIDVGCVGVVLCADRLCTSVDSKLGTLRVKPHFLHHSEPYFKFSETDMTKCVCVVNDVLTQKYVQTKAKMSATLYNYL